MSIHSCLYTCCPDAGSVSVGVPGTGWKQNHGTLLAPELLPVVRGKARSEKVMGTVGQCMGLCCGEQERLTSLPQASLYYQQGSQLCICLATSVPSVCLLMPGSVDFTGCFLNEGQSLSYWLFEVRLCSFSSKTKMLQLIKTLS